MMKQNRSRTTWILGAVMLSLVVLPFAAHAQDEKHSRQTFEVTITNLTKGQILSPPIVFSHRNHYELFTPGEAAIPELASVAEDAASDDLLALLGVEPLVGDVSIAGGGVMPGESMTVEIQTNWGFRKITALGMLVTSNDAFYADTTWVQSHGRTIYAQAWDAGSEANTQSCDHIPGPPCGSPGERVEDGAEGYIYPHAGIQARGDLDPEFHDWNNPVAKIEIKRAHRR